MYKVIFGSAKANQHDELAAHTFFSNSLWNAIQFFDFIEGTSATSSHFQRTSDPIT